MTKRVSKSHTSDKIQALCEKKGLSFEGLFDLIEAEDKSISKDTVKSWYYRDTLPRSSHLATLCRVLDCDANYLLGLCEETTLNRQYICKETGLSEDTITVLQKEKSVSKGELIKERIKPYGSAINFLVMSHRGRSLLTLIIDYLYSEHLHLSYQGEQIKEDIEVNNTFSEYKYSLSPDNYDSILLTQISQELASLKSELKS